MISYFFDNTGIFYELEKMCLYYWDFVLENKQYFRNFCHAISENGYNYFTLGKCLSYMEGV